MNLDEKMKPTLMPTMKDRSNMILNQKIMNMKPTLMPTVKDRSNMNINQKLSRNRLLLKTLKQP